MKGKGNTEKKYKLKRDKKILKEERKTRKRIEEEVKGGI